MALPMTPLDEIGLVLFVLWKKNSGQHNAIMSSRNIQLF